MKIGDKFIAEKFEDIRGVVGFAYQMGDYIGKQCTVLPNNFTGDKLTLVDVVKFDDGVSWFWLKSALKPIKSNGFYVGQKVYSHLFPTGDCSATITNIYDEGGVYDVEIIVNSKKFFFSKDGRYSELGGICLFDEPIERPKPKITFEYGELVWASNSDDSWTLVFFNKTTNDKYECFTRKDSSGNFTKGWTYDFIKKYE